jgi:hypothetical protein
VIFSSHASRLHRRCIQGDVHLYDGNYGHTDARRSSPVIPLPTDRVILQSMTHLQRLYRQYNRRYFHGKLPKCKVQYDRRIGRFGWLGEFDDDGPVIRITNEIRGWDGIVKSTLLHEMVHLELNGKGPGWKDHGREFDRRMLRLAKQGAFRGIW